MGKNQKADNNCCLVIIKTNLKKLGRNIASLFFSCNKIAHFKESKLYKFVAFFYFIPKAFTVMLMCVHKCMCVYVRMYMCVYVHMHMVKSNFNGINLHKEYEKIKYIFTLNNSITHKLNAIEAVIRAFDLPFSIFCWCSQTYSSIYFKTIP